MWVLDAFCGGLKGFRRFLGFCCFCRVAAGAFFGSYRLRSVTIPSLKGLNGGGINQGSQRLQYPLMKEYTLNHIRDLLKFKVQSLKKGILESLGSRCRYLLGGPQG